MKEALKGMPVEEFQRGSGTVLAKRGSEERSTDDEAAAKADETFYPEDEVLKEKTPTSQATSQQFFKNDLDE
jgi:hypothetical protein